ncbi:hypothetical protein [Serratia liquefaciens]
MKKEQDVPGKQPVTPDSKTGSFLPETMLRDIKRRQRKKAKESPEG